MNRILNFDESNLSITMKMADLKALFFYWEDEWAKKLAEANKVKEKQEWYFNDQQVETLWVFDCQNCRRHRLLFKEGN